MTTTMQPFQCDLPPQLQETHRTTHTGTTTRCKPHRRNNSRQKRPQPHPPHRRGTFHRRLQPLYTEKHKVSCSGFLPQHSPCNIHAAITLRFAASRSEPAPIYGRGNTKWQQSCSHSNAICHHSFKKRIELRTQEQPLVAKHIGGTIRDRNDPSRTRRTDEVPFIAGCSHFTRKNTRFRAPASSPQHSPCNIHAAITRRFAASRSKPAPIYGRGNTTWQQSCSHSNAICHHSFKKRIELRTQEQPLVAKHIGGTIRDRNDSSRTRRTDEVPFIAGCSHFTRKNTRFRAPASSPQHSPCNIHAAITLRFAASRSKPAPIRGRGNTTWQQSCSHSNAICHHSFKKRIELRTQEQPLVAKHIGGTIRDRNDPSRTRRTDEVPFIAGCSHFTRKNTRFRAPASSPQHSPCNIHAAITLRFAASRSKPAPIYGRGNTTWQQSCSHSNAICHHSFKKRIELRTQEQPLVANHIGGTIRDRNDPSRTRRTDEVPFIAGCSRFTQKNAMFRAPASSPQHSPCNIMHHSPSWLPVPFLTTPLHHHFPSSPLPFLTTSLRHHSPSSSFPFFTTSLRHHFPSSPLPFVTTSLPHHFPSSPLPFFTTSLPHHFPSSPLPFLTTPLPHHFPSSPLPFLTTSLPHHFPSPPPCVIASYSFVMYCNIMHHSPSWLPVPFLTTPLQHHFPSSSLPFFTTSLPHHFPSSPLPFVTNSLPHHFPSSPLPFLTTSLPHHFPSSPLPFFTTSLRHHSPSSSLPFVTTSLPHHFPSSPLPFLTTSLRHHSPSSSLPFFTTSLLHHFPSSPLPFFTTSFPHHFPSSPLPFIITSLLHHFPSSPLPFIIASLLHPPYVIASYSFVMYCFVIYHPSSRSTA